LCHKQGVDFLLFERDPARVRAAVAAGIRDFILDWETRGKEERQAGADLEQNADTPEDVRAVRALAPGRVICRVNPVWDGTAREVDAAVEAGASVVLLPMVRGTREVEAALAAARGRAGIAILIETVDAVERARELSRLPLAFVYVGLNDLRLERRTSLWAPIADGTLERVRAAFSEHAFGFAGVTFPDRGEPIPCRLLFAEMARHRCDFGFLRRQFKRDAYRAGVDLPAEVAKMRAAWERALARAPAEVEADRRALLDRIASL
jgi:citrate lyase beta subunit